MDYNSIPENIRVETEQNFANSRLNEEQKEEARRQINEIYWIAASNPNPIRLRWLYLKLRMGIYYQKLCRLLGL